MYEAPIKKMKKIIICMLFAIVATSAFAQEKGKTRLGFDLGYYNKAGLGVDINFLYNIQDNMNVGIKGGYGFKTVESQVAKRVFDAGISNFSAIYNYYIRLENRSSVFLGGGLGRYGLGVFWHDHKERVQGYKGGKFGGSLTTGIEIRKCRLALEYNFIPSSSVLADAPPSSSYGQINDKVKNNYLAITAGFFIGGGKWK